MDPSGKSEDAVTYSTKSLRIGSIVNSEPTASRLVRSKPGRFIGIQKSRVIRVRILGFIGFIIWFSGAVNCSNYTLDLPVPTVGAQRPRIVVMLERGRFRWIYNTTNYKYSSRIITHARLGLQLVGLNLLRGYDVPSPRPIGPCIKRYK